MTKSFPYLLLIISLIAAISYKFSFGTENAATTTNTENRDNETIRVYLDCEDCDFSFIRRNIDFVNYTRDPKAAQVHILVTDQETASGGVKFNISFIGRETFADFEQTLRYISPQSDTEDIQRRGLTRVIKMGLLPFVSQTPIASRIDIKYSEKNETSVQKRAVDSWNYWVFQIDVSGNFEAEKSQNQLTMVNSCTALRITENWKILSQLEYQHEHENIDDDGEKIKSYLRQGEGTFELVKSLDSHWSLGLSANALTTTYENIDFELSLAPAIEYNFYPWILSDRKSFTIGYYAGFQHDNYIHETLYSKFTENLFYQSLKLKLELKQPWGELEAKTLYSHYFHDMSKYRLDYEFDISLRVTKGLSFVIDFEAENIHDQLYLPKGNASLKDILLKRKRMATDFDVSIEFGVRYAFGSIYNNIVNDRL